MLEWQSIERDKRSIVIPGIVGFPGPLLDHDSLGITPAAADLRVDIILPIATGRKTSFSVLEVTPADIAWKWTPSSFFQLCEEIVGFLRRCCKPRRIIGLRGQKNRGSLGESILAEVGGGVADRRNECDRAAQGDEQADDLDPPPVMGGHRSSYARRCDPDEETVAFSFCEGQTSFMGIHVLAWMSSALFARMSRPVCAANETESSPSLH